jgi:hypothetical protein
LNWLNELPGLVHALPREAKLWVNGRSLRPGVAGWVRPRFDDVRVNASREILRAREQGGRIMVETDAGPRSFDHVLLATGYRIDISKLGILAPDLLARIERENTAPVLSAGMEATVKGLHFVGASAVASFGPLMRFIAGAPYASRAVTRAVLAGRVRIERRRSGMRQRALMSSLRAAGVTGAGDRA